MKRTLIYTNLLQEETCEIAVSDHREVLYLIWTNAIFATELADTHVRPLFIDEAIALRDALNVALSEYENGSEEESK